MLAFGTRQQIGRLRDGAGSSSRRSDKPRRVRGRGGSPRPDHPIRSNSKAGFSNKDFFCRSMEAIKCTGYNFFSSKAFNYDWIIDIGASHHVTPYKEVLDNVRKIENQNNSAVQVPTGGRYHVAHTGNVKILEELTLKDVLHVPDFKFNLMLVSKLTKELSCCAALFPHFYVFQGLYSGKVLEVGKEHNGLYLLKKEINKEFLAIAESITQV
ncbi:hypothetical protein A4A49_52115 [Nicotiana attenuata]|uniref:Retrovirus-related Pol polyprotein from transposon TNT 1-94-like beta-barrel domain-containing protein n=1 Tax=Nicotiana attenuata TaxID=49451 RepID=A0A314LFF5_NICAT|nr:hypothetical protein A4A49_52115 [Nicotiana attenuata]